MAKNIKSAYNRNYIRLISRRVYESRLGYDAVMRAIDDPSRGVSWIERNSELYDTIVRAVLDAVNEAGLQQRGETDAEECV